jgi:hypothetical protein
VPIIEGFIVFICDFHGLNYHFCVSHVGYQHYDFCVVKELAEPSMKLAEQQQQAKEEEAPSEIDKDK